MPSYWRARRLRRHAGGRCGAWRGAITAKLMNATLQLATILRRRLILQRLAERLSGVSWLVLFLKDKAKVVISGSIVLFELDGLSYLLFSAGKVVALEVIDAEVIVHCR